jgi:hypothetical protein
MRRSIDAAASSYGGFSVRGVASGGTAAGNASGNIFGNTTNLGPTPSNSSDFNVRGAASSSFSRNSTPQPTFGQQSSFGKSSSFSPAAPSSSNALTGFGHYSAQGVPAFPGVHGGPSLSATVSGTQRRTAGTWSWTKN